MHRHGTCCILRLISWNNPLHTDETVVRLYLIMKGLEFVEEVERRSKWGFFLDEYEVVLYRRRTIASWRGALRTAGT